MSNDIERAAAPAEEGAGGDKSRSSDERSDEDDADLPDDCAEEDLDGSAVSEDSDSECEGGGEERRGRVSIAVISARGVFWVRVVSCRASVQ
eukprot:scaffold2938_cov125-Isochrysis_galbana.AAC.8